MLEQQQILKQTISLSQRQSLEVLAMNNLDLQEFIGQEQLENPLLEVEFPSPGEDSLVDLAQWLQPGLPRVENGVYRDEDQKGVREPASGRERTYREDLKEQLYSLNIGAGRRELAERVVELIDSRGFLPYTDLELCQLLRCSPGACQAALGVIRSLEPFGVGSRDLGEFLTRQLADKGLLSPALTEICSSFLPVLAEGNYREISAALGLELPVVRQCARLIAALRPWRGRQTEAPPSTSCRTLWSARGKRASPPRWWTGGTAGWGSAATTSPTSRLPSPRRSGTTSGRRSAGPGG